MREPPPAPNPGQPTITGPAERVVVLGAGGQVGRALAAQLRPVVADLRQFDLQGSAEVTGVDALVGSPALSDALGSATVVVNCLPDAVAQRWAATIMAGPAITPGTLLVDTVSVKTGYLQALSAAADTECLSINPLFGPDLGFSGRPVAAVRARGGPRSDWLLGLIRSWGAQVVELSGEEHDRAMAVMQAGVHAVILAFGALLGSLPDPLKGGQLGTPPYATMTLLLARVLGGNPAVYWAVQHQNPLASEIRHRLIGSLVEIDQRARSGDQAGFLELLTRIRAPLGPDLDPLGRACAKLFEAFRRNPDQ